jgi:pimeloyl-ACP methyl ester carboxylesterase
MATEKANRVRSRVILLPGGVVPAQLAYADLITALGSDVEAIAKELELYARPEPPPGYTLDTEVDGIIRTADDAGFDRFHLVGYSGGGAASVAFVAAYPERLLSLALIEPAWLGNDGLDTGEQAVWREFERIMDLPAPQMMSAFVATQLAPGVEPPPPSSGPPPLWMTTRPAGLRTLLKVFRSSNLDVERLRAFTKPVLFVVGGRSNPDYYAREAERASRIFPKFALEVFQERHHFDPPHRIEPERTAAALNHLWAGMDSR